MPPTQKASLVKYLQHYAEREVQAARQIFQHDNVDKSRVSPRYRCALVIPCFDENSDFFQRLIKRHDMHDVLVIIVINQAAGSAINVNNTQLFYEIKQRVDHYRTQDNLHLFTTSPFDCLVVDRFSAGQQIPVKQGVGLARKIGADIACQVFSSGFTQTPWIYSTDADAHLPDNYFSHCDSPTDQGVAQVFDFAHHNDGSALGQATQDYELAIKYYRSGLQWAGSPYAFYTLGSTLAVSAWAYAQVRGFPKRAGGEDFYVLNKLAKVGRIQSCSDIHIRIDARLSQRVPFGTGPAVQALLDRGHDDPYRYYHPAIFDELQQWLRWCTEILPERLSAGATASWHHDTPLSENIITTAQALSFETFLTHAAEHCRSSDAFITHFHIWFDAFRTLKFVRYLSNTAYPDCPLAECLSTAQTWQLSI